LISAGGTVDPSKVFQTAGRWGMACRLFLFLLTHWAENNSFNVLFFNTNKYLS